MPTLLGVIASSKQTDEVVVWESDFSEYAGTAQNFLPETGWTAHDWLAGAVSSTSAWKTTNSAGVAYLHITDYSSHLHYDTTLPYHEVEADVIIPSGSTHTVAGVVLAVNSSDPTHYVGLELVWITASSQHKIVGYARHSVEETFYDPNVDLAAGGTYHLRFRIIDNFVTAWMDDVRLFGQQLTPTQIAAMDGHTRAGVIHFGTGDVGVGRFDNVVIRRLVSQANDPPIPPINVAGTAGAEEVSLTWDETSGGNTDYIVQYALASAPTSWTTFSDATSATPSATVTGLTADVAYIFRVAAVSPGGGQGPYSTASASVTPVAPGAELPTTNLVLHLEADALALSNGDPVSTWTATVGNSPTRSGTSRPTYIAAGLNGLPTVRFDGTDDYMDIPLTTGFADWTAGFTQLFVTTPAGVSGNKKLISFDNSASATAIFGRTGAAGTMHVFNGSGGVRYGDSTASLFAASTPVIVALVNPAGSANAANTATFYKDNTAWGTADSYVPPVHARSLNTIGNSIYGAEHWNGDISEVVIYNRALDSTEMAEAYSYLADKYGF